MRRQGGFSKRKTNIQRSQSQNDLTVRQAAVGLWFFRDVESLLFSLYFPSFLV